MDHAIVKVANLEAHDFTWPHTLAHREAKNETLSDIENHLAAAHRFDRDSPLLSGRFAIRCHQPVSGVRGNQPVAFCHRENSDQLPANVRHYRV